MALLSTTCVDCVDVQNPIQRPVPRQRRWAEADAEFLKWVKMNASNEGGPLPRLASSEICDKPEIYGGFSSRQKYLRSYTFSKGEESVAKKTIRYWMQPKEKGGSDKAAGERSRKTVVVMRSGGGSGQRPCSVLNTVLSFLFMCVAKVEVEVDPDPVH